MAGLSLCASSAFVDCGAETLPRNEERSAASSYLPEAFSADPERLARFQREAEVLASLNHPNIAAIHGLEEADGIRALVLELVEGPTLANRIKQGPIPLDEALPIAKQIAEALEAAHEAGVIHRDLKPANIKVRDDGTVKVLDFGLAKALDPNPEGDPSQSPTLTAAATQMGVIMGTAAYMSPEQARGKPTDRRADIWAFGAVLFEMLTGKRAFEGEDVSVTLADVIRAEPAWDRLPESLPPSLQTYLRRCLEKDPAERVQAIGDMRLAMKGAFETAVGPPLADAAASQSARWRQTVPWVAGIATGGVIAGLVVWTLQPVPLPASPSRFVISAVPSPTPNLPTAETELAISPDGSVIVYRANVDGEDGLYLRHVNRLEGDLLWSGAAGSVFFSPDGTWVGFSSGVDNTLKKIPITGGPAVTLCAMPSDPRGASWGPDETIIFSRLGGNGLFRVSAVGGEPEMLTKSGEQLHYWPDVLPGGRAVLFSILQGDGDLETIQIAVLDLDSGDHRVLIEGGTHPRYVSSGHLVYSFGDTLRAVGFDAARLEVVSEPVPVLAGVNVMFTGGSNVGVSDDGTLVYLPDAGEAPPMVQVDRNGNELRRLGQFNNPRLSPDGRTLSGTVTPATVTEDVILYDLERGIDQRFTFNGGYAARWSADGETIYFGSGRNGQLDIFEKQRGARSVASTVVESDLTKHLNDVSKDGRFLLYDVHQPTQQDLWVVPLEGDGTPQPFLETEFDEDDGAFSPDGRWIAYHSDETGVPVVYVQAFPDPGEKFRVSTGGGVQPRWAADMSEMFYRAPDGWLMSVPLRATDELEFGAAVRLFDTRVRDPGDSDTYEPTDDGETFFLTMSDPAHEPGIVLVQNWFEELTRLVPTP